ncbi:isoleucine--tRNA ligase, cytoplasmic-like [Styela clava]
MVEAVPEHINFPAEEEKILKFWNEHDCFQNSLKQSKGKPRYAFYDGPPFATGLPHYGHILAGTIKDIVTRYAHHSGFHVDRRFGWDCHGLPVEYEIDKTLGIKGPEDVAKMGIAEYNKQCRSIVMRYSADWENIVNRLGRWIDFKNDYKTLYPWFMESVWWVFKQLYDKGFVYKGFKVMPYSTGCHTPLSNFEASQNYKDTIDPAVIINFPLDEDPKVKMIAWTTTPWTLPSNLALCVHPDMDYVKVRDTKTEEIYILMKNRLISLYKEETEYEILDTFKGKTLFGKGYQPLFPYFAQMKSTGAFRIMCDTYVTDDSGTGVVHQAPFFGADDYRICTSNGIVAKDGLPVCPVDASGKFTDEVKDFAGVYVKDADKLICRHLKGTNRLVHQSTTKHNYPFCWRSETPLLYKAVPSWFIRVENITKQLLENNAKTYWVPNFVKEKRFANWLRDAHDWAVSRNRYWGTPIPLWVSEDFEEIVCIGSIEELEQLSGVKVTDLHRESVDGITIPSRLGKGVLRRISEVFDCWFESGSMPYAQMHYPFENKKEFEDSFPAHFIAEGIDQTRGWFYTLLVLSTALFGKPPFQNLIVNGLVLASDGQKMSKRKKNYPDPIKVVHAYGADALRLYLINSPVVRAENLRFQENGVRDILKDVFLPWYNAYRFFVQNVIRLQKEEGIEFKYKEDDLGSSDNIMDKWILSSIQSLVLYVKKEMKAYHLYTVVPRLVKFVDLLTNWYVRSNRKRLKGDGGPEDCQKALQTLYSVLYTMIREMSPFTPFLTEHMYQNLKKVLKSKENAESIHYLMFPDANEKLINVEIERAVSRMQTVIELGRIIRDRNTMPIKYPLPEVVIIHKSKEYLDDVASLERYVSEELNVRKITTSSDKDKYEVSLRAQPDHMILGKRLKGEFKQVSAEIAKLSSQQVEDYLQKGSIEIGGHQLGEGDLRIIYHFESASGDAPSKYAAHSDNDVLVLLDVTPDPSMIDEGVAREIVNRIQKLRKKAKLVPTDEVTAFFDVSSTNEYITKVANSHAEFISSLIKSPFISYPVPVIADVIIEETVTLKGTEMGIALVSGHVDAETDGLPQPACKYVNVEVSQNGVYAGKLSVLLENPKGCPVITNPRQFKTVFTKLYFNSNPVLLQSEKENGPFAPVNGGIIMVDIAKLTNTAPGSADGIFAAEPPRVRVKLDLNYASTRPELPSPACSYVNVKFVPNSKEAKSSVGSVLLDNPPGRNELDLQQLTQECSLLFGLKKTQTKLFAESKCTQEIKDMNGLHASTVYVKSV